MLRLCCEKLTCCVVARWVQMRGLQLTIHVSGLGDTATATEGGMVNGAPTRGRTVLPEVAAKTTCDQIAGIHVGRSGSMV